MTAWQIGMRRWQGAAKDKVRVVEGMRYVDGLPDVEQPRCRVFTITRFSMNRKTDGLLLKPPQCGALVETKSDSLHRRRSLSLSKPFGTASIHHAMSLSQHTVYAPRRRRYRYLCCEIRIEGEVVLYIASWCGCHWLWLVIIGMLSVHELWVIAAVTVDRGRWHKRQPVCYQQLPMRSTKGRTFTYIAVAIHYKWLTIPPSRTNERARRDEVLTLGTV